LASIGFELDEFLEKEKDAPLLLQSLATPSPRDVHPELWLAKAVVILYVVLGEGHFSLCIVNASAFELIKKVAKK
jgi:hypothetical protein